MARGLLVRTVAVGAVLAGRLGQCKNRDHRVGPDLQAPRHQDGGGSVGFNDLLGGPEFGVGCGFEVGLLFVRFVMPDEFPSNIRGLSLDLDSGAFALDRRRL